MDWHGDRIDLYCSGGCHARVIVGMECFETNPSSTDPYTSFSASTTSFSLDTTRETPGTARTLFIFYSARHISATLLLHLPLLLVFCSEFLPFCLFLHPWPCVLAWYWIFEPLFLPIAFPDLLSYLVLLGV